MVGLVDIAVVIAFVSCFIYLKVISVTEEEKEGNDDGETEVDGRRVTGIVGLMLHTVESGSSKIEMASMGSSQTGETKVVEDVKVQSTDPNPMHQDKSNRSKQHGVVHERSSQKVAIALSSKSKSKLKKKISTSSSREQAISMVEINDTKQSSTNSINPIMEKHVDPETGRTFLYNAATGETRWEKDGSTTDD